jgi:uncharacterized protein
LLRCKKYNLTIGAKLPRPGDQPLKLQPDRIEGVNAVTGIEPGTVRINGRPYTDSIVLPWRGEVRAWPCNDVAALTAEHFAQLLAHEPELLIFGSGARIRFVAPALLRALIERGIGVETMDTAAACRTYNVLAAEGRAVVAALLLETGLAPQRAP